MNSWALVAAGDVATAKQTLRFFAEHQRADGKMPHEISQSARWLRWFEDFPYAYYHADTTPLFLSALADYVRATGDDQTAGALWPAAERAFAYCRSTDEDGDGLMDNTRAGLAAVETGALRSRDVLTDVYLAGAWTDATGRYAWLARRLRKSAAADEGAAAYQRARAALNRRFAGTGAPIPFALMKDGTLQGESTVWPSVGVWRGHFDAGQPAVARTLDALAGPDVAADWGARMLGQASALYDPLSYNNGAVWPFVTGFAALALYAQGRPDAAFQYTDALGQLAFLESRGYTAELLSGDRLRSVDAAVPHQLFATSGFVSALLRGLVGFDAGGAEAADALVLRPVLPAGWNRLDVRNLRWRGHRVALRLDREAGVARARVDVEPGPLDVDVEWRLPPGASPEVVSLRGSVRGRRAVETRIARPGVEFAVRRPPLAPGEVSSRLRVIDAWRDGDVVIARVAGRRGRDYVVDVYGARGGALTAIGASVQSEPHAGGAGQAVAVRIDRGPGVWGEARVVAPVR
jgi:glycogen debranching enzyme